MQLNPTHRDWAAGPRRRVGLTVILAILVGGVAGGLLGGLIEAVVLPGATFAVIASTIVGVAVGIRSAAWLIEESDEPRDDG